MPGTPDTPFWSLEPAQALRKVDSTTEGLGPAEAARRLAARGRELRVRPRWRARLLLLWQQFNSPIVWLLAIAAGLSFALQDRTDATIIFMIVLASGLLGYRHEAGAADAVEALLAMVETRANVLRDGQPCSLPFDEVVAGDVVVFAAGDGVPGDCRILDSRDLFVNESTLTGETFPAEKHAAPVAADAPIARRDAALFMGTYVISGQARAVVMSVGAETEFGRLSDRLAEPAPTEFERGVRQFGAFLMEVTLLLVLAIFAINVYLAKPVLEALLFSLALAVGLTPQLLPAIISVNLAHGARRMAEAKVIVKRLSAIENLGAMDVLCSDKTGTLTQGVVTLSDAVDVAGTPSARVRHLAFLNATLETGMANMIDQAICAAGGDLAGVTKLDEVPYDFVRKRLTVLVQEAAPEQRMMITKGALENVLAICTHAEVQGGLEPLDNWHETIMSQLERYSQDGFRVLGVAIRAVEQERIQAADECEMTFVGYILFFDPPKSDAREAIAGLADKGVALKVITGDNRFAAAHTGAALGLDTSTMLTGPDLMHMSQDALAARIDQVSLFAEIEPTQKERIILAARRAGHVVGYMGDGINDGPALHAADVGISVNTAVAVAKEAAAIVLLEQDLGVLVNGVHEGRVTFANTLKYVFMATSANFGNMFSMAGASLFLPFLPLLPGQVLLTNLLTDFPEMAIAFDSVDTELVARPRRWDIGFIRRFMLVFGLLSSVFDYVTFGVLLWILHASAHEFQAGWFVESVASAASVVLVIRTRRPAITSQPGRWLLVATVVVVAIAFLLPDSPLGPVFEFHGLPPYYYGILAAIVAAYLVLAEVAKWGFYRREEG